MILYSRFHKEVGELVNPKLVEGLGIVNRAEDSARHAHQYTADEDKRHKGTYRA